MSNKEVLNTIKSVIHSFLPDARVLLFGSRARGDFNKDSDFDLLIITMQDFPDREKITCTGKIRKALVDVIKTPFDIIFHSKEEVEAYKNYYGHIVRYAMKEAIEL